MNHQIVKIKSNIQNLSKRTTFLFLTLILFVFICISIFIYLTIFRSPKAIVLKAVNHTLTNVDTTAADYLCTKELRAILADGRYQTTCNLALEDYTMDYMQNENYRELLTLAPAISVKTQVNYPDKLADHNIDLICGGASILTIHAYAMDDMIGVECPSLYDGCLSYNTTTLAEDYNQSYLRTLLKNRTLDDKMNIDLFSAQFSEKNFLTLYREYYSEDNKALYDAMTVKKGKEDTIQVGMNSVLAKGYEISIPREHMEKAIDNLLYLAFQQSDSAYQKLRDQLEASLGNIALPEEFVCTVYIDPKSNSMLKFIHTSEYQIDEISNTVTSSIEWTGEEYPTNSIRAVIDLTDPKGLKKSVSCNISSQTKNNKYEKSYVVSLADTDNNTSNNIIDATMEYAIDTKSGALTFHSDANKDKAALMNLDITGSFTNIEPGKNIFLDIDHATLTLPHASASLTGDYAFETLQTEVPEPTNTLRPVFKLSGDDFYGFVYEVIRNFSSSPLGSYIYK